MAPRLRTRRRCTKPSRKQSFLRLASVGARGGLTLVELLMTIAVLGILAAILIPQLSGDLPERLNAAAQVAAADLDYARSLAVANNSTYRCTFDVANNRYVLRHSGTAAQFNTLPPSPFRQNDDAVTQQTTNLSALPIPEPGVRLIAVVQMQSGGTSTTDIEFNALGGTTCPQTSVIWLACGRGTVRRYISVLVDPITGLVTIAAPVATLPSTVATIVQQNLASESQAAQTGI